jgi:hypothetical protein
MVGTSLGDVRTLQLHCQMDASERRPYQGARHPDRRSGRRAS